MPIIGGKVVVVPGVYPDLEVAGTGFVPTDGLRIPLVIGISEGGDPGQVYTFRSYSEAKSVLRSGRSLSYLQRIFSPSPSRSGASVARFIRCLASPGRAFAEISGDPPPPPPQPTFTISVTPPVAVPTFSGGNQTNAPLVFTVQIHRLNGHSLPIKITYPRMENIVGFTCTANGETPPVGGPYEVVNAPDTFTLTMSGTQDGWQNFPGAVNLRSGDPVHGDDGDIFRDVRSNAMFTAVPSLVTTGPSFFLVDSIGTPKVNHYQTLYVQGGLYRWTLTVPGGQGANDGSQIGFYAHGLPPVNFYAGGISVLDDALNQSFFDLSALISAGGDYHATLNCRMIYDGVTYNTPPFAITIRG